MKDLPPKLTAKIPTLQKRDDSDDDTDEEGPESEGEDLLQVDQAKKTDFSSQRERLLLEKINFLTQKLEEATRNETRTTKNRTSRIGSRIPMSSSLRTTQPQRQEVQSVHRY